MRLLIKAFAGRPPGFCWTDIEVGEVTEGSTFAALVAGSLPAWSDPVVRQVGIDGSFNPSDASTDLRASRSWFGEIVIDKNSSRVLALAVVSVEQHA